MIRTILLCLLIIFTIESFGQSILNPTLLCENGWRNCTVPNDWKVEGVTARAFSYNDNFGELFPGSTPEDVFFSFFSNGVGQWGGFSQIFSGLEANKEYCLSFEANVNRPWKPATTIDFELYFDDILYDSETFIFPSDSSKVVELCFMTRTAIGSKKLLLRTNNLKGLTTYVLIKAGSGSFYESQTTSSRYESFENKISISPNPTTGVLSFQLQENLTEYRIAIYSARGIKKFEDLQYSSDQLDLSFLETGLYYVEIIHENKRMIEEIIVSK